MFDSEEKSSKLFKSLDSDTRLLHIFFSLGKKTTLPSWKINSITNHQQSTPGTLQVMSGWDQKRLGFVAFLGLLAPSALYCMLAADPEDQAHTCVVTWKGMCYMDRLNFCVEVTKKHVSLRDALPRAQEPIL